MYIALLPLCGARSSCSTCKKTSLATWPVRQSRLQNKNFVQSHLLGAVLTGFQANAPKKGPLGNALEHSQNEEKGQWLGRDYARVFVEVRILSCLPSTSRPPGKPRRPKPSSAGCGIGELQSAMGSQPKRQEEPAHSGAPQALRSRRFHKTAPGLTP